MAAACDHGIAERARAFVRDNELVTLTALVLLHTAHSAWMVVLLLGLDGRVHLKGVIASALGRAARRRRSWRSSSVVALVLLRAFVTRAVRGPAAAHLSITVRVVE